jgi:phosphoribosylformimino-5-aminoimidazole carboxamide ribotide isomerase
MRIERFQDFQAGVVSNIIRRNLIEVNSRDYPEDIIRSLVEYFAPENILKNAQSQCIFVAIQDNAVVGTASLANFGSAESPNYYAVAVFVLPELHGHGIGTRLIETVESKAWELKAEKITVRASITAKEFYQKLGYQFKDGEVLDDNQNYVMEKKRTWNIYPAIDLRQGRVVRLMQGDPNLETEYADDPLHVARRWQAAGTQWLHVVNLDGALDEALYERGKQNLAALECVLTTGLKVQFGGGMRDLDSIRQALDLGVSRAVIGTAAVENPTLVETALTEFGSERIALGLDARDGIVRTHGWKEDTGITAVEMGQQWAEKGVRWVIFTDVSRDGMGTGLNLDATVELAQATQIHVIASGGVATLEDVQRTYNANLSGIIIGRALYEGSVVLEEALRVGKE